MKKWNKKSKSVKKVGKSREKWRRWIFINILINDFDDYDETRPDTTLRFWCAEISHQFLRIKENYKHLISVNCEYWTLKISTSEIELEKDQPEIFYSLGEEWSERRKLWWFRTRTSREFEFLVISIIDLANSKCLFCHFNFLFSTLLTSRLLPLIIGYQWIWMDDCDDDFSFAMTKEMKCLLVICEK